MSQRLSLICFLGNPGRQYENTRHNAAWQLLSNIERSMSLTWELKFKGRISGHGSASGGKVLLYCSHGFMNKSGEGLGEAARFHSIPRSQILVVHDELDMVPGKWKYQDGGGLKGHNGLRSVSAHLGGQDFHRLALGIGRPSHPGFDIQRWVLSAFSEAESAQMNAVYGQLSALLDECIRKAALLPALTGKS